MKPVDAAYISDEDPHLIDTDLNILRALSRTHREWFLVAQATGEAPLTNWSWHDKGIDNRVPNRQHCREIRSASGSMDPTY